MELRHVSLPLDRRRSSLFTYFIILLSWMTKHQFEQSGYLTEIKNPNFSLLSKLQRWIHCNNENFQLSYQLTNSICRKWFKTAKTLVHTSSFWFYIRNECSIFIFILFKFPTNVFGSLFQVQYWGTKEWMGLRNTFFAYNILDIWKYFLYRLPGCLDSNSLLILKSNRLLILLMIVAYNCFECYSFSKGITSIKIYAKMKLSPPK